MRKATICPVVAAGAEWFVSTGDWVADTIEGVRPVAQRDVIDLAGEVGSLEAFRATATQIGAAIRHGLGSDGLNVIVLIDADLDTLTDQQFDFG